MKLYYQYRMFMLIGGVLSFNSPSAAQKKWTIDDILHTERIVSATISPDGNYVFYQTGYTADGYYPVKPSHFYAINIEKRKSIELEMHSAVSSPNPNARFIQWSPDSKYIAYLAPLSNSEKKCQLWLIAPQGGKPKRITNSDNNITVYSWAPDGSKILYVTDLSISKEEYYYKREWGEVLSPEERTWTRKKIVWVKNLSTGLVSQLTDSIVLMGTPQWSHDSREIAYISEGSDGIPHLYKKGIEQKARAHIISNLGDSVRFFAWAPNNNTIAYICSGIEQAAYVNYHESTPFLPANIWLYSPGEKNKKLTEQAFPQLASLIWANNGKQLVFIARSPETAVSKEYNRYMQLYMYIISVVDGKSKTIADGMDFFRGGENITWSKDDKQIWFVNGEGVGYNLFRVDVGNGKVSHVTCGKDCNNIASFDKKITKVSFIRQNVNLKPDVYVSELCRWNPRKITDINPGVEQYANEHGEIISYSCEGWNIEALLIKPPGFNPKKKYPLIVVVHGGPNWHKLNDWQPDWEQYPLKAFSAAGYVLLFPNFRGSANYGPDFIKTTHYDLGGQDYRDVMRGVDYLISQNYIDETKMGICGWSYGGFLTPSIITKTNRFKAAQFGAGLPSIEAMYGNLWTVERILHKAFEDYPWDNGAMHLQYSPLYHTNKVTTPTLIQHGDKDPRCPVSGAVLFYKALKSYGIPTVLEIYPRMGHSITDPVLYRRILTKNLEWFNKWLKEDTTTSFERIYPRNQKQSK
ncbi:MULTISPECIES: alpha/beta hydrolase family protein [unclassified Prevotella]|uniref:S9 family peptidase n=1 Tax=unclassified Prevotella TaxID=2638335 RepID=UPI000B85B5E4|nr:MULTISPECIES: S9 family peptidase [unclassified Prevotella]